MCGVIRATFPGDACHPYEPFKCPGDGNCISIQYLCDGAPDCPDGYDEDSRLCTAAKRPPVEETGSFLKSLLASHGPNYLEKLFGSKARDALKPLGGVDKVAIALSGNVTPLRRCYMFQIQHRRNLFCHRGVLRSYFDWLIRHIASYVTTYIISLFQ